MSRAFSRFKFGRRPVVFLFAWILGLGLVLLVMASAAHTPAARANAVPALSANPDREGSAARPATPLAPQAVDLEVGKEGPDQAFAGRVVTYTIHVTNHAGVAISGAVVTDTWVSSEDGNPRTPAEFNGTYWTSPPGFVQAFTYTLPTEAHPTGRARWTLESLSPGFQGTIQFTMRVPVDLQPHHGNWWETEIGPFLVGNSAGIVATGFTANEPDQVVTEVEGPLFKMDKSSTTEPGVGPRPGRLITYSLRLENVERSDAAAATGIVVWEILPSELIFEQAWAEVPGSTTDYDPASRHITWTLAPDFRLQEGQVTTVHFAVRLSKTQPWKVRIDNRKEYCKVISNEMVDPVDCWTGEAIDTLGIFDKTYVTAPEHRGTQTLPADETYPNRYITYTVYVFNPLSQTAASSLRITDVMPPTWDYIDMVDGPDPVWPSPEGAITDTIVWEWPSDLEANGVISFTFLAHIGPDTPVSKPFFCGFDYFNDLAAEAEEFPIVYGYGKTFETHDGLAPVGLAEQVRLSKTVYPSAQVAGDIVTYTLLLRNQGDQPVSGFLVTDTLPVYFRYERMVSELEPMFPPTRTIVWSIPHTIAAQDRYTLTFRASADGVWQTYYPNSMNATSPETTFCPRTEANVQILSPIVHQKEPLPPLGSGEWVVQGESFTYTVEYWNRSELFTYTIDMFYDELPIFKSVNFTLVNYDGFDVNGQDPYTTTTADGLPFKLLTDQQNSWRHTFTVDTPGFGAGTEWCDSLKIAEESSNKQQNQEIYQEKGTFGLDTHTTDFSVSTANGERTAPILFKPHVDLYQTVDPKRLSILSTVEVTLTLVNNTRNHQGGTARSVDGIVLTYTIPDGFTYTESIGPNPPTTVTADLLIWADLNLPLGEGQKIDLPFRLQTPPDADHPYAAMGYADANATDASVCIPTSEAEYRVNRGVEVEKRPTSQTTGPFGTVQFNLKLINRTSTPVTGLTVTDTLPGGFTFLGVVDGYQEPDSIKPLVWRNLDIPASPLLGFDQAREIRFLVRAPGLLGTNYCNQVIGVSDQAYVTHTLDYTDNVCVSVLPGVALYKTVNTAQADAGGTVVYTLTVHNLSGKDVAGVRVTDTLPLGFAYQDVVTGTSPVSTTPKLVWTVERLNNGEKAEFIFSAAISEAVSTKRYCNRASATAHEVGDPSAQVTIPDTDEEACVDVQGLPNVERSKIVSPTSVRAGDRVTYTITLYNDSDDAQTLRLTDTLPLSLTYVGVVDGTPAPVLTAPVVWEDLSLGLSETLTLTFQAQVDLYAASGFYYNRLDARTTQFQLLPRPDLAPLEVQEIPRYDLQVSKSDGRVQVDAGDILIYTIAYTNANEADLTLHNVVLTDTFDPQLYATPLGLGSGWQQVAPDQYTYAVGDLGPGASGSTGFTLALSTSIPDAVLVISNAVQIDHDTGELAFETDADNNRFTDLDILQGADLIVTGVTVSPTQPAVGQPITFAVTVRNQGDAETTNALGAGWFPVDLYLKGSDFVPAGTPGAVYSPAVFDHYGSYCADYPDCVQQRPEYFDYVPGLTGNDETTLQFSVVVTAADDYAVYVQVDTSFTGPGIGEPWGHEYGLIQEAIETNNVYSHGMIRVSEGGPIIYLPTLLKNHP